MSDRNREALKISRRQGRSHLLVSVSSLSNRSCLRNVDVPLLSYPVVCFASSVCTSYLTIRSAWFAFLLPSYATFKALSHRPLSEHELQRWTMYWSVVGPFVAFEYTAEWLISWYVFFLSLYQSLP